MNFNGVRFAWQIKTVFTNDIQGFALTDKTRRDNIVDRVTVNSVSREIVYRDFNRLSTEVIHSNHIPPPSCN